MTSLYELQKLHWRTVTKDERDEYTRRRAIRFYQYVLSGDRFVQIVNFERHVRDGLYELRQRALRLETHPLDAEGIALMIGAEDPVPLQVRLPWLLDLRRDSDVMVPAHRSPPFRSDEPRLTRGHFGQESVWLVEMQAESTDPPMHSPSKPHLHNRIQDDKYIRGRRFRQVDVILSFIRTGARQIAKTRPKRSRDVRERHVDVESPADLQTQSLIIHMHYIAAKRDLVANEPRDCKDVQRSEGPSEEGMAAHQPEVKSRHLDHDRSAKANDKTS